MKNFLRNPLLFSIKVYQKTISPDHSVIGKYMYPYGCCKFYPTCSQYMYEAICKYGITQGIGKGVKRLVKCHPRSQGGYDPLV